MKEMKDLGRERDKITLNHHPPNLPINKTPLTSRDWRNVG
jgi:hypothetical protein